MRILKIATIIVLLGFGKIASAQELPIKLIESIKEDDDAARLADFVNKDNINSCFTEGNEQHTLLWETIRWLPPSPRCFNLLIEKGADVNKCCGNDLPPLMVAITMLRELKFVKRLVESGANINYTYQGTEHPEIHHWPKKDDTPLIYAEREASLNKLDTRWNDVIEYLQSVLAKK